MNREEILKVSNEDYIKELERALIFLCECYVDAKEAVQCRETSDGTASGKYTDLWFHFPLIQGSASWAVDKIADLRTPLGNREENKMTMGEIFERMCIGRKTQKEIEKSIRDAVAKSKS